MNTKINIAIASIAGFSVLGLLTYALFAYVHPAAGILFLCGSGAATTYVVIRLFWEEIKLQQSPPEHAPPAREHMKGKKTLAGWQGGNHG